MVENSGRDRGFTLIELLIVVVVLGVLATVVVFAVRGISDQGDESACAADLRTLATAQEAHAARFVDEMATEAELVTAGLLREESALWDISVDFSGSSTISPAPGSGCSGGSSGNGTAAPPDPGPITPTPISFGSVPAFEYGVGGANDEVVVFGRVEGLYDYTVTVNEMTPTSRRVTFIDLDLMVDESDIDYVMTRSRSNGVTDWAIYPGDDTTPLAASGGNPDWPSVGAYLATVVGGDPYHQLSWNGTDLSDLLAAIG